MEEKKKNNAETLEQVKKEYQKSCMTQEQVEQMKKQKQKNKRRPSIPIWEEK